MKQPLLRRLACRGPRWLVIAVPYLWLLLFFAIPFAIVLKISFARRLIAMPPYTDAGTGWTGKDLTVTLNISNYLFLLTDTPVLSAPT